MRESVIETYLVKRCKAIGGVAEKFTSPNKRAVPDRICQFKGDLIVFVECKATGEKPTEAQKIDHDRRRARGHDVWVIDSIEEVERFINQMKEVSDALIKLGDSL